MVDKDLTSINQNTFKNTINELIVKQELPASAITTPRTFYIYFLPKIHKPNNSGRPIVSACSCPTELISSYLDKIMAPIVYITYYTVIPNGEGLLALKHFFDQRTVKEPKSETLLRLAELVLTLNCF